MADMRSSLNAGLLCGEARIGQHPPSRASGMLSGRTTAPRFVPPSSPLSPSLGGPGELQRLRSDDEEGGRTPTKRRSTTVSPMVSAAEAAAEGSTGRPRGESRTPRTTIAETPRAVEPARVAVRKGPAAPRLISLDLLRGLLLALMAWDHVRDTLTDGGGLRVEPGHPVEGWSGDYTEYLASWPLFVSRAITHTW